MNFNRSVDESLTVSKLLTRQLFCKRQEHVKAEINSISKAGILGIAARSSVAENLNQQFISNYFHVESHVIDKNCKNCKVSFEV